MGILIGMLIAMVSGAYLMMGQLQFFERSKEPEKADMVIKKVASQFHTVFNASYMYLMGIGTQPASWSISELKNVKLLPATFDDRTALGQGYFIYYVRNACNNQVMDIVVKIEDTGDSENERMWEKAGLKSHQVGRRYVYSAITQLLEEFEYPKDMKNPCGVNQPPYEIGYILNGKVYVNGVERNDLNIPTSMLSKDGVFIYGYAPNQWGYLVVSFSFLRGDEPKNEYYDYTGSNQFKQMYSNEYLSWRQADILWAKDCPSGYVDLSSEPVGATYTRNSGWLNFCVPAFKSDLTKERINRLRTEMRKYYGVDVDYTESNQCVVVGQVIRVTNDLDSKLNEWVRRYCSNYSDTALDNEFSANVSRWLYVAHQEAWGGRSVSWLQQNEPLLRYPQPNLFIHRSITFKDPLQNRYYQLVAYFYKFYTGTGCTPSSLGINGTSNLTEYTYPSNAAIWATGWKLARSSDPVEVSSTTCSSSYLGGKYSSLGTSQRFTSSEIVLRVLDNQTSASQYTVSITWRKGKLGAWRTFNWVIQTPIY